MKDYAEIQVKDYAEVQVKDYAEVQVKDYAEVQVKDYAEVQVKDYAEVQVKDYAEVQVKDYAEMGPRPRMTLERRYEALSWRGKLSEAAIARKLGVARRTIQCLFKKYEEAGSVADKKGRGQKRLTTQREDRMLIRKSLNNRRATSRQLAEEMQKVTGKQLSTTTVKTRLLEAGLKSCRAARKPLLTAQNRKSRLLWARAHKTWTVQQWRGIQLFSSDNRQSIPFLRNLFCTHLSQSFSVVVTKWLF
ncbi:transposable element Tcb1 transposase [Octopus vulgaris]|uniref:Transposable element Tcb1 transposase n=1 Tax=Octopus vulgaris TaxID=6645 RepID=A0AA36APL3_OCTVU|nr:transposable element Tcb1 transposase [Octopus vulgaris]